MPLKGSTWYKHAVSPDGAQEMFKKSCFSDLLYPKLLGPQLIGDRGGLHRGRWLFTKCVGLDYVDNGELYHEQMLDQALTAVSCYATTPLPMAGRTLEQWLGQGTSEYTAVVNEQNNLYIACNDTRKVTT